MIYETYNFRILCVSFFATKTRRPLDLQDKNKEIYYYRKVVMWVTRRVIHISTDEGV